MVDVVVKSKSECRVSKLVGVIFNLEEQQGYSSHNTPFNSSASQGIIQAAGRSNIEAADLIAHFHFTGAASTSVQKGKVVVDGDNLPMQWYEEKTIQPLSLNLK